VRQLFAQAREQAPCVVFFDEIDAVAQARDGPDGDADSTGSSARLLTQLLNEMDGIQGNAGVLVVGCTNRPLDEIDPAMLRPGM
jgi:SpoVK/Ycf46/Vps4 family AAA+-type ATPase